MSEQAILDLIQKMHAKIDAVTVVVQGIPAIRKDISTFTKVLEGVIINATTASKDEIQETIRFAAADTAASVKEHLQDSCKEVSYRLKVVANLNAASSLSSEQENVWNTYLAIRELGAEIHSENQKTLCALKGELDQASDEYKALNAKLEKLKEGAEAYNRLLKSQVEIMADAATLH